MIKTIIKNLLKNHLSRAKIWVEASSGSVDLFEQIMIPGGKLWTKLGGGLLFTLNKSVKAKLGDFFTCQHIGLKREKSSN